MIAAQLSQTPYSTRCASWLRCWPLWRHPPGLSTPRCRACPTTTGKE